MIKSEEMNELNTGIRARASDRARLAHQLSKESWRHLQPLGEFKHLKDHINLSKCSHQVRKEK